MPRPKADERTILLDARAMSRALQRMAVEIAELAGTENLVLIGIQRRGVELAQRIAKLIEQRSDGVLQFHVASLYPLLYRMEKRGLIKGTWIEKTGQRRRRFYKLMPAGKKVLNEQRQTWSDFFTALDRVAKINPA